MKNKIREIRSIMLNTQSVNGKVNAIHQATRLDEEKMNKLVSDIGLMTGEPIWGWLRVKIVKAICSKQDKLTKE